eukprot:gene6778-7880_t
MDRITSIAKGFLSNAISPVKEFDLKEVRSSTKFFRIHDAIKKSSGEEVSVFLYDKKLLEKSSKQTQEDVLAHVRKEAQSLLRLRHPAILNMVSPVEDVKTALYFATEPILATLAGLMEQHRSRQKSSSVASGTQSQLAFEELEIQLGISQLLEGVHFLNTTAKLLHRNISPESIYITKSMRWKIGGLGFACSMDARDPLPGSSADLKEFVYEDGILPTLDYIAPEYIQSRRWEYNSDLFSIGRVIAEISLNLDNTALGDIANESIAKLGTSVYHSSRLAALRATAKSRTSDSARVCNILLGEPGLRGDIDSFHRSSYFSDIKVKSLVYLANIVQKEDESKLTFFRGLLRIINQFSHHIQTGYILPVLIQELANERIDYVVLPNVFAIAANMKKEAFNAQISSHLIPTLTNKEPKCLSNSSGMIKYFENDVVCNGLVPRLTNLCVGGFPLHIRTKAINWFSLLVPILEKKAIVDAMIPNLEKILSIDNSPPILEALVYTYEAMSKKLGAELLALKVLPALIPLSADKHLDLEQFKTIMRVVKDVLTNYESERINELNNLRRYTKNPEQDMDKFANVLTDPHSISSPTTASATPSDSFAKISIPSTFIKTSTDKLSPGQQNKPPAPAAASIGIYQSNTSSSITNITQHTINTKL